MNILIVESKAKCKTLQKFLGKAEWRVMPTGGHVERLAEDRKVHPRDEVRKAYWSNREGELPDPPWYWKERGEDALRAIREEAARHDEVSFYLASDPDREGERIAWHLDRLLADLGPCHRVAFQEITKAAVLAAVAAPRELDRSLIDAALIRAFIDRVVGWRASRIASRYTDTATNSMGRVQTPALGFIVERELEREAHVPVRYFEVIARTALTEWRVRFHERSDAAAWLDEKGRFSAHRTADIELARSAHAALVAAGELVIDEVKRQERSQPPSPAFSTDALLQAAGSRWGWSPKKTAALAGQLYEAGHLTYVRTDSTRLASEAVEAGRTVIAGEWGAERLGAEAVGQVAGAQDAHEAIRPTVLALVVVPDVEPDVQRLYALVRARTLAALMIPSRRVTLSIRGRCAGLDRGLEGTVGWYEEPGWRVAFETPELGDETETEPIRIDAGTKLVFSPGDTGRPNPELREDETMPPARYRAHTLVKAMKESGIGRPSTYAKTVELLEERGYVEMEDGGLAPTPSGRNIWLKAAPLYSLSDGREVFRTEYTAAMEAVLDGVSEGTTKASEAWETMLGEFKSAHAAAQDAVRTGALVPRTRARLADYVAADPSLATEIGDLDAKTEEEGRALLDQLRERGIRLLASEKQLDLLASLLEDTAMNMEEAAMEAELLLTGSKLLRDEASTLIDFLKTRKAEHHAPSTRQMNWIADLVKKAGLDEKRACFLVGLNSFEELSGGRGGTASALIDRLREGQGEGSRSGA